MTITEKNDNYNNWFLEIFKCTEIVAFSRNAIRVKMIANVLHYN